MNNSIDLYADLKLKHEDVVVGIQADGTTIDIFFSSFASAIHFAKSINSSSYTSSIINKYRFKLKDYGIIVVIHIRKVHFTILGPKTSLLARIILRYILKVK